MDRRAARVWAAAGQLHPGAEVAALRERTRYRKKLIESRTSELQRLAKVCEDGGIKIDSVASSLTTASARDMIEALIAGERDPAVLARAGPRGDAQEDPRAGDGLRRPVHRLPCPDVPVAPGRLRPPHRADRRPGPARRRGRRAVRAADRPAGDDPRDRAAHRRGHRGRDRRRHVPVRHQRPPGRLGRAGARATTSPPASARRPPPARATGTCAPRWSSRPGPPPAPPPARAPGSAAWPAGSAAATRRKPPSPSPTPCCASPGQS